MNQNEVPDPFSELETALTEASELSAMEQDTLADATDDQLRAWAVDGDDLAEFELEMRAHYGTPDWRAIVDAMDDDES
jgi:hypothetical protein